MSASIEANDYRDFLASVYLGIRALLQKMESYLKSHKLGVLNYSEEALAARLLQECAFQLDTPLRKAEAKRTVEGAPTHLRSGEEIRCGGLRVSTDSGMVKADTALVLSSLLRFAGLWFAMLWYGTTPRLRPSRIESATLVMGIPDEGMFRKVGDDAAFAEYTRHGPIRPLASASHLVIQSLTGRELSSDNRITYVRHPVVELLRRSAVSVPDMLRFAIRHFATGFLFLVGVSRQPLLSLLWRDFGLHASVESLNDREVIEAVVITNSNWHRQLICLTDLPDKRFDVHMIFYSQHDRPVSYVDMETRCETFPSMRLLRSDCFWLWTNGHAKLLESEGVKGVKHVVGPIVWEIIPPALPLKKEWVSIFDIPPLSDEATQANGFLGNYYSTRNMIAFVDCISNAMRHEHPGIPVVIKPKRQSSSRDDPAYRHYLDSKSDLVLLDPTTSALRVIAKSAVVIVYPFSTVAYLADHLGVPSIYFDPTGKRLPMFEAGRMISYAESGAGLVDLLGKILRESATVQLRSEGK